MISPPYFLKLLYGYTTGRCFLCCESALTRSDEAFGENYRIVFLLIDWVDTHMAGFSRKLSEEYSPEPFHKGGMRDFFISGNGVGAILFSNGDVAADFFAILHQTLQICFYLLRKRPDIKHLSANIIVPEHLNIVISHIFFLLFI